MRFTGKKGETKRKVETKRIAGNWEGIFTHVGSVNLNNDCTYLKKMFRFIIIKGSHSMK